MRDVTFYLGNAESTIDCERSALYQLDKELAIEDPGAFFARQRRPGWDGLWHFVNVLKKTIPTGLVERAKRIFPLARVIDKRIRPAVVEFNKNILEGINLLDYQCDAIKKALSEKNGILALSVGAGKTECGIAAGCHVHGLIVWIVHRKDLLHQTVERIKWRTGIDAAVIGDGAWSDVTPEDKFLVVMPQSALKDIDMFANQVADASMMVADECHTASAANEWYRMSQLIPAYFRIGLTGTPEIGDPVRERRLEAATGKILVQIRAGDMAATGRVVPAKVQYHKVHNLPVYGMDYMQTRRILIEENGERNAMIVEIAMREAKSGKRVLVICDTIRHARVISEVLNGESVRSMLLTGKHNSSARAMAKKNFKSGALEVMITTPIWDVGVDIPELEVVILAAGGKSAVRVIQRAGRAIRSYGDKKEALIHDFFDTGSKYTMNHSMARMQACKREGFEIIGFPVSAAKSAITN
jgi:superfamily II DNA or RNA helicase